MSIYDNFPNLIKKDSASIFGSMNGDTYYGFKTPKITIPVTTGITSVTGNAANIIAPAIPSISSIPIKKLVPKNINYNIASSNVKADDLKLVGTDQTDASSGAKLKGAGKAIDAGVAVAGIVGNSILEGERKNDYVNPYGVTGHDFKTDYKENRLNSTLSGIKAGEQIGSMIMPGIGTAVGAAVGAIGGFFLGKRKAKKKEEAGYQNYANMTFNGKANYRRSQDANMMAALAKAGMKMKISEAIKAGKTKNENIPGIDVNLIPKGTLHARKNSIGDKGLPVVTKDGKKVLEIEKEEIIFTKDATDKIESMVAMYDKTSDDKYLIKLGRYLSDEILNNTVDLSDKFSNEIQSK